MTPAQHRYDFWTVNSFPYFGVMPGGVLKWLPKPAPICLFHGEHNHRTTNGWGEYHIAQRHAIWIKQASALYGHSTPNVPLVVWKKLQQGGNLYETEGNGKFKIALTLRPEALLLMNYIEHLGVFSIITIYAHPRHLDGMTISRFVGAKSTTKTPPTYARDAHSNWCPFSLVPPGYAPG